MARVRYIENLISMSSQSKFHNRTYSNIQPKIGHYYSRSPSPQQQIQLPRRPMTSRNASRSQNNAMTQSYEDLENRRPMTSRSASRNAMTQVDDDLRSRYIMGRYHSRFFVQVGHETTYCKVASNRPVYYSTLLAKVHRT